jgi:hypothetical protein
MNASSREFKLQSSPKPEQQFLQDVISWLVINSMRVDGVQFNLLCEQSVSNIWRKGAFASLLAHSNEVELDAEVTPPDVAKSLVIFRERIDYSIDNSIPVIRRYSEKISSLIDAHRYNRRNHHIIYLIVCL